MLRKILFVTLLVILLTTACGAVLPSSGNLTLTDGLGREVKLNGPAQHVVSLAPSNTEILFAIGAGGQVVGRDALSDFPAEAKNLIDIGSTFDALNTEQIVSLKPDLVLAAEINTPEQVKQLEALGLTVYYLKNPLTLEEMYGNLGIVGQLTGHEKEASTLTESLKARVAAVDQKIAPISSRPNVFYELMPPTRPSRIRPERVHSLPS